MVKIAHPAAVVLALLVLQGTANAQEVVVEASVDSTRYRMGAWINLSVRVEASSAVASLSPMIGDTLGIFEILRTVPPKGNAGEWKFRLIAFEAGSHRIPPIEFQYTVQGDPETPRRVFSQSIPLLITGMEIDPAGDIKDIKPPLEPPWRFEDTIPYLILLGILAVLGVAYYLFKKRRRPAELRKPKPAVPAHQVALSALRQLEDKRLWQQGKVKEYYSEVTEIIRRFFEGRLGIEALELTSAEILQQLEGIEEAKPLRKEINAFFLTADLVKFATYKPTPDEHASELRWAYEIVRSMIPRPVVPESSREEAADVR